MSKNVFITGAGSAIAHEVAKLWAQRQCRFFLVDKEEHKVKAVAGDLQARGATEVEYVAADLAEAGAGVNAVRGAKEYLGKIDLVLVAHGYLGSQERGQEDVAHAERIIAVNFTSVVAVLTELAKIAEEEMTVGVITSVGGDRGRQGNYIYGAAKGGLALFVGGLRCRMAKKNKMHLVTIKPGFVDTPMTQAFEKKGLLWSKPEDVAKDIFKAMLRKKDVLYTPWFWRYIMLVIIHIPERIFKRLSI